MGRVTLLINARPYEIGCDDGGEAHLRALGAEVDTKVRSVAESAGAPGEARLMLMAALMIAEDVQNLRRDLAAAERRASSLEARLELVVRKTVEALDTAAARLDAVQPDPIPGSDGRPL